MPDSLDDPSFVLKNDPKGMMGLTMGFPDQCRKALSIASDTELPKPLGGCRQVVVVGMGGSAAGGDFLRGLFESMSATPCFVVRDYDLPKFVSEDSLVIVCSYSGNTEETLSATAEALGRGCKIMAVSSGGAITEIAEKEGIPVVRIPSGQPPRTALGFLFVPIAEAAIRLEYLPEMDFEAAFSELARCARDWGIESEGNPTKKLAMAIHGGIPVIYGLGGWQGIVASRWKSQINENSKSMAFANAFPELNHNEIMGWTLADRQSVAKWSMVILEGGDETRHMRERARVMRDITASKCSSFTISARGADLLTQMLTLTYYGDFVSMYLAALYGVDPESIDAITKLKGVLAALP
ncbi:MAG TPA: bifunctional phosphoglucose/phosphomannose isomerase [Fimbriimonadales bacterium]|jgi:glucose/mannose-6-phosphate isomerase|nr:bifunctional phosphoglucose/phosphomannose isomerase [Fimbriimonadales bacterium]